MRRLPGEPGDYVWIAVGLAMIAVGLWPFMVQPADEPGPTFAQDEGDGADGSVSVPSGPRVAPPRSPVPTLPDVTRPPLPLGL